MIGAALVALAGPAQAHDFRFHHAHICAAATAFDAVAGTPFSGSVATFRVEYPFASASDFRALIEWGDGAKSVATVTEQPSGEFVVDGTHTYTAPGSFYTTVLIGRFWHGFAVVHGTATVSASPPSVTGISPAQGPTAGGTSVTITGTDLTFASSVDFGGTPATAFTVDSDTQVTATAPPGTGTVDVAVSTPGGTSATSTGVQYTYVPQPAITALSPAHGPLAGGTTVKITGTDLSGATNVEFGGTPATGFTVDDATQITATAPAGAGTVDIAVTTPGGTSATGAADQFSYVAPAVVQAVVQPTGSPTVLTGPPTVQSSSGAGLAGSVNPQGLATTAHFEYGLDSRYSRPGTLGPIYDHSTSEQPVGTDFSAHQVLDQVSGLVPNALYHARLVATNNDGTAFGPDVAFTTPADPAPPPPALGNSFNVTPVAGLVLIKVHGVFIPLTQVRAITAGSLINTLNGTLKLTTATSKKHKTQSGTFGGAVFKVTQFGRGLNKGLTTLALAEGAVTGGPSYASCQTRVPSQASASAVNKKVLQLLHATDNHGKFRTKGRYSAATVRGTVWSIADRCDGTLTHVTRGTVVVADFVRHVSVVVHTGHSYLALAKPKKHK
jgi:hypothetical protein